MNILLTGAAGFIGSHLLESLLHEGARVTAVDNFDSFYPRFHKEANLAAVKHHPGLRLCETDICDIDSLHDLAGDYDCLVHLAAKAGVRPSIADPVAYHRTNVTGTRNLLECARTWGVRQFVFASSSSVYGISPKVPWSEDNRAVMPISPYASTKLNGELLGHAYSQLYGIRFVALRLFTVYGPRQRPDLAIRKFSEMILANRPIPVFGDGSTSRDYTFVGDIVPAIRAAMDYRGSNYEIINVGNEQPVSLLEMIRTVESALGETAVIEPHGAQPGDVPRTWARIAKAKRLLGYSPKTTFAEGVLRFVSWLRERSTDAEVSELVGLKPAGEASPDQRNRGHADSP